jgi:hypothetical protein
LVFLLGWVEAQEVLGVQEVLVAEAQEVLVAEAQ